MVPEVWNEDGLEEERGEPGDDDRQRAMDDRGGRRLREEGVGWGSRGEAKEAVGRPGKQWLVWRTYMTRGPP